MKNISFKNYFLFKESIVDIPRDTLDTTIFSFPTNGLPILQSSIKKQIIKDVDSINNISPVRNFFIIGSILTKRYNDKSDIDVNIEVDENVDDITLTNLISRVKKLNGNLATGTIHPINYYIVRGEYDLNKTDAAYDVVNNKWMKIDKHVADDDMDLNDYIKGFQDSVSKIDILTGELKRDINDIDTYKTLPTDKIKKLKNVIEKKLEEIEDDIVSLIHARDNFKELRKQAFDKNMSPKDIVEFKSKNWLPENITYKLLAKYYYMDFISRLEKFLEENDDKIEINDVDNIKRMGQELWQ